MKRWDIFISYCRADEEDFARRLFRDLSAGEEAARITIWWDLAIMESRGRTFVQEILEGIEKCDRILAIISPNASKSQYVTAEWDHALRCAKAVIPILRGARNEVPPELVRFDYVDFCESRGPYAYALQKLRRRLAAEIEPLAASPASIPALPDHFLSRAAMIAEVENLVLLGIDRVPSRDGAVSVSALYGMAGAGQTTIAAAFARSPAVRKAFKSILWITIGQTPNLLESLRSVGTALGDPEGYYNNEVSAAHRLQTVLAERRCLIILDDVWEMRHVEPFRNAMDVTSRLLITRREGELVTSLGANECAISELRPDDAIRLLRAWAGEKAREADEPQLARIADECGCLPLPLALCGALIRDGNTLTDILEALADFDFEVVKRTLQNYPHRNVIRAIEVSTKFLSSEDEEAVRRFRELVIFPADERIAESAIVRLWSSTGRLKERQARHLLVRLARKQFLRIEEANSIRWVSMHDVVHDYLHAQTPDALELHAAFLRAYNPSNGPWHGVADDGYIHKHLTFHLESGGCGDDIPALLRETTSAGHNAWYQALERQGALPAYVADVRRAWRIADESHDGAASERSQLGKLPSVVRYALCLSSAYSITTRAPAPLLALSLRCGARTWARVRSFADLQTNPLERARVLAAIAPSAPRAYRPDALRSAVNAALSVQSLKLLADLARSAELPNDLSDSIVATISPDDWQVQVLMAAIAPQLTPSSAERALRIARKFEHLDERARVVTALLQRIPNGERNSALEEVIEDAAAPPSPHCGRVFGVN